MLSLKDIKFLMKNKKARDTQGLFVAEGEKLVREAPPADVVQVLVSRSFAAEHPDVESWFDPGAGAPEPQAVDDGRFASLSDTRSPQGIMAVVRQTAFSPEDALGGVCPLVVVLENLQDPGNAGTILRTAEAAGVDAVFLTEGSVDLYSPKTTRATMGSIYRVPHFYVPDGRELLRALAAREIASYAAHLKGSRVYTDCGYRKGTAFVIGNESRGVTEETAAACSGRIRIPMMGRVESLNAAMAAGILMYEARRQRRTYGETAGPDIPEPQSIQEGDLR